ncbi:hypothetical protein Tsubulata_111903 [Turnera subulata]|uniref:ABC transporter domain-containing protein n=1 Tax=Turnera subulata TaxID=218843 RepID=A0A9Q0J0R9_9ROSI|nr:hypothetical protein Tsubulata_111903 [Turnera subulata]
MEDRSNDAASFGSQTNALFRKNLTYQKRRACANFCLISFPVILCLLFALLQGVFRHAKKQAAVPCGCTCANDNGDGKCEKPCNWEQWVKDSGNGCPVYRLPQWPPLLQVPANRYRAVRTESDSFMDLPDKSCRLKGSCPVTVLFTGSNQTLGEIVARNMFTNSIVLDRSNLSDVVANTVLGSDIEFEVGKRIDPAFLSVSPLYNVQYQCSPDSRLAVSVPIPQSGSAFEQEARCVQALNLWRNTSTAINEELFKGYAEGMSKGYINKILAAYDLQNSNRKIFNATIWYNPAATMRVARSVNLASNAYLQFLKGPAAKMVFEFVKEMPRAAGNASMDDDLVGALGPMFFAWVILQLFPVVLTSLVYEKQQKLRIMMKMHGLGDGPYWLISYAYFLAISTLYMLVFVIFGASVGLKTFRLNNYAIQIVFYFLYINLQISFGFLLAALFSNVKKATVVSTICVFGTGLVGAFVFNVLIEDSSIPNKWKILMELYPGFSLYRGLYELKQYTYIGGMQWKDLNDSDNGMKVVWLIMVLEWIVVIVVAYTLDQIQSSGSGSPLLLLQKLWKKPLSSREPSVQTQGSKELENADKPDVCKEREQVEQLLVQPSIGHAIICDDLKKVYPGMDGNPEKLAVKGLSLAIPQGECFGMLGPNGAGKTSFISMMIGLSKPTSGAAYVQGLDLRTQMNRIHTKIGVCPQHDLLWETLTGREHLLFYGRLKKLKGSALKRAVEESLKSVNLFHGGVADKKVKAYSGGMKRRLSVAISLIGDPKVVYMDEPSTGLDPASRSSLWNILKQAKKDRAIILTTHSMEEAEHLCDRLGIFVDGSLQCIGNPNELKSRYGGSFIFTMTTSVDDEQGVVSIVQGLSPNAERTYHMAGTQKFEMPKHEVRIADVFNAVEDAKSRFTVFAWGLSDTTLEDVFIKVASGA